MIDLAKYPHKILNTCRSGALMGFQHGRFDNWCVYFQNADGTPHYYFDHEYFATMRALEDEFGGVFKDYHSIWEQSTRDVDNSVFNLIRTQSLRYDEYAWKYEEEMSVIYLGMVAEENKQFSIIGNRMKMLGMYQVLELGWDVREAANFSKGKKWRDLRELMRGYGIWVDRDTDPK